MARPCTSCLWAGGPAQSPHKPMPGTSNFGHFDHFSLLKKSILSFCLSGVSENAILTYLDPIWALLSLILAPGQNVPICSLCPRGPWRGLEGPILTLIWPFLDPFEGPEGRLVARPHASCLWAGGPVWSLTNPCPKPQILVILTTFGPPVNLDLDPLLRS